MTAAPRADARAAAALGEALRTVGYTEESLLELLGDDAYSSGPGDVPVHARRLDDSPLALTARLLFLGLSVPRDAAERALGAAAVEALRDTGLADVGSDVVPLARVLPVRDLLVAADGHSRGADDPPDYVAPYTPSSRLLDSLTPRRRIRRALDVGTGSGVQALRAAAHARAVVATDVNPRALAYTQLNAALNGLTNVETRAGGLFEPAGDEPFDLVTCNAPFVVSPEERWTYRDTGAPADELSERVVRGAAERLADGGHAAVLVSWVASDADEPDERVLGWVDGIGCDSWILPTWERDPLDHAAAWNSHLAVDADAYARALDAWSGHLADRGIAWIAEGAVLLHRHGGRTTARIDELDEDALEDASAQVVRAFEARAELAGARLAAEARLAVAGPVSLVRDVEPRRRPRGRVTVGGTGTTIAASDAAVDVIAALDGRTSLRSLVRRVGRGRSPERLERECLRLARHLLELGALRLVS